MRVGAAFAGGPPFRASLRWRIAEPADQPAQLGVVRGRDEEAEVDAAVEPARLGRVAARHRAGGLLGWPTAQRRLAPAGSRARALPPPPRRGGGGVVFVFEVLPPAGRRERPVVAERAAAQRHV